MTVNSGPFIGFSGVTFSGNDLISFSSPNAQDCQEKCQDDEGCEFIMYGKQKCTLKGLTKNTESTVAIKSDGGLQVYENRDMSGKDESATMAKSESECWDSCLRNPKFQAAVFSKTTGKCSLKMPTEEPLMFTAFKK